MLAELLDYAWHCQAQDNGTVEHDFDGWLESTLETIEADIALAPHTTAINLH